MSLTASLNVGKAIEWTDEELPTAAAGFTACDPPQPESTAAATAATKPVESNRGEN